MALGLFGGFAQAPWSECAVARAQVVVTPDEAPAPSQAPRVFVDLGLRTKLWPNTGTMLLGPTLGVIGRPFDKCVHLSADLFAGFTDIDVVDGVSLTPGGAPQVVFADGLSQLYALSLGALWGNGDADHWMGAGAVLEGGYARLEAGTNEDSGFALDLALRAQLRHRLRKAAWVFLDVRIGHALVKRELDLGTAESAGQFGPVLAFAIGGSLGP